MNQIYMPQETSLYWQIAKVLNFDKLLYYRTKLANIDRLLKC